MQKAKITFVVTIEYEMNPGHYPEGATPQDMLDIDLAGADDDPMVWMDNEDAKWAISGELIKEN